MQIETENKMPENKLNLAGSKTTSTHTYLITYCYPLRYRGSYVVTANDSIEAGNKVRDYLQKKWGRPEGTVSSIVTEVYGNAIQFVG